MINHSFRLLVTMAMKWLDDTTQVDVGPADPGEIGTLRRPKGHAELQPTVRLGRLQPTQVPVTVQGVPPQRHLDVRRVIPCQRKEYYVLC